MEKEPNTGYAPRSFKLNLDAASVEDVVATINAGPVGIDNARIGIAAPGLDLQTLDALNDMQQVQANLIRIEQAFNVNGTYYLQYAKLPDHACTLQSLLQEQEHAPLPED